MSLQQQLDEFKVGFVAKVPADVQEKMAAATQALADSGMLSGVPKEGDILPEFTLPNQLYSPLSLSQLRANGPVLIVFYRGGWCPYCNLELRVYQAALDRINAAGAMLVAITPELADESLNTIEKNELGFQVLTDENASYARQLGLVHTLPDELRPIYDGFGIDLQKHNGKGQFDLPLPATYIVDTEGVIVKAFVDVDYTQRMEPEQAIVALEAMATTV
ncbi:AhpC/TSA family protein [Gammaproteobacteria bacterium AH-315-M22]|nr:AhpC/TSA family protein [Gammaproteobacteria bacterium AH-315-M22]